MAEIASVSLSDIQPAAGKGPDERDLEASLKNPDEDPEPRAAADSADQDSRGPSEEGELRDEEPADEGASENDDQPPPDEGMETPPEEEVDEPAPKAAAPPPPKGFASWEEATKAVEEANALRQWAEYGRSAYHAAQQAAAAPPKQQDRGQEPLPWAVPYVADPRDPEAARIRNAYLNVVQATDPAAALKALPPNLQAKVQEVHDAAETRRARYMVEPGLFYDEQVVPFLETSPYARATLDLLERVAQIEARHFVQGEAVLKQEEAKREFRELLAKGVPQDVALRLVKAETSLKARAQAQQKVDTRARTQQAQKVANRASQAAKRGSGRTGVPAADEKPSADFAVEFERQKRRILNRDA